jgi:hypothetical protein
MQGGRRRPRTVQGHEMRAIFAAAALAGTVALPAKAAPPVWSGYAGNAQHTAAAPAAGQKMNGIVWQTPVDLDPQKSGNELFIHYGSPMFTANNVVLVPVKTKASSGYQLEALAGKDGTLLWTLASDWVLPPAQWTPPFPAQIDATNRVYVAGAGGTVLYRNSANKTSGKTGRLAFYGIDIYNKYAKQLAQQVMIDTPITADASNNIYFGFVVTAANKANLKSGIARIAADGTGTWVSATAAANSKSITQVAMNCAPAISADGSTVYITVSNGSAGSLLALDSTTLATKAQAKLIDPSSGDAAWVVDLSSAAPTVGPDGDVYYGVLENPYPDHNNRGWLLHFDATLATVKTPGSFGWDATAAVVPASAIPSYTGGSSYLLMMKYNNYLGMGNGDGQNKIAVLDPTATQPDEYSNPPVTVMKEVETLLGPTKAPDGGVYEWCINSAVVDAKTSSVFAGSEDGNFYRWNIADNSISQKLNLNPPQPEAYTPSLVGPDGKVYAINNATLYAIGKAK